MPIELRSAALKNPVLNTSWELLVVQTLGRKRPSPTVSGGFNDSDRIQATGISVYTRITMIAIPQRTFRRGVFSSDMVYALCAGLAPRNRVNITAIRITQTKISTDTAEPRPRFSRLINSS